MNLSESAVVLRPRSVSEVVDLSLRVTFSLAQSLYLRIAAFTLLPALAVVLALRYAAGLDPWVLWPVAFMLAVWLEGAFTVAASRLMFREQLTGKQALAVFGRRATSYTAALLYKAILLTLAALPFLIPLIAIGPHAVFVTEASVLEQAKPTAAWTRSKRLVAARSGDAMAALLSWSVVRVACIFSAELLFQGVIDDLFNFGKPFGSLTSDGITPFALIGLFVSTPIIATARFLQYIDTRTRGDGWDIQVKFMAILAREDEGRRRVEA